MTTQYELLAIFPNAFSDEEVTVEHKKLLDAISGANGTVLKGEIVGRKRFSYPVKNERTGVYTYIQFELEPGSTSALEQAIRLNIKTRRYSITKYIAPSLRIMPKTMPQATIPGKHESVPVAAQELKPEDIEKLDTKIEELLNEEIK